MKALTYTLEIVEPVLAAGAGGGDPNSAETLPYLPGSLVRGILAQAYLNGKTVDAAEPAFRERFLASTTQYLNAYPQTGSGQRALPTPLSLKFPKDENLKDALVRDFAVKFPKTDDKTSWKRIAAKAPFCSLAASDEEEEQSGKGSIEIYSPRQQIELHIARQDRQKVTQRGSVFVYRSLTPGQKFLGYILSEDMELLNELAELIPTGSYLRAGRSRSAGYGLVQVTGVWRPESEDQFVEYAGLDAPDGRLILTFLSDALLRNPLTGAYTLDLEQVLGIKPAASFARTNLVGGFNRVAGLPLPQGSAIAAGSVFVFDASETLKGTLQEWVVNGIGDRTNEGYGRVALNWNVFSEITFQEPPDNKSTASIRLEQPDPLALKMVERMARRKLDRVLTEKILSYKIEKPPSNAQLSRVRMNLRKCLADKNLEPIKKHFGMGSKQEQDRQDKKGPGGLRETARKQFQQAQIGRVSLLEWVVAQINDAESGGHFLGVSASELPSLGGLRPDTKNLAFEYSIRMLDGVFRKTIKERQGDGK